MNIAWCWIQFDLPVLPTDIISRVEVDSESSRVRELLQVVSQGISAANTLEYKYFGLRFCSRQIIDYFEQKVMLGTEV